MASNMNRILIAVPEEIEDEVQQLKQTLYPDRPDSEIYQELIRLGVEKKNETVKGSESE